MELTNKYDTAKCCACKDTIPVGTRILWDPNRPSGQRVVHKGCSWPELPAETVASKKTFNLGPKAKPKQEPPAPALPSNVISMEEWRRKKQTG